MFLLKKWKMVFFCKKSEPFLNAGCIMYSISIFFTFYLFGGHTHPLPTGLGWKTQKTNQPRFIWMTSTNTEVIKLSIINA